MLIQLLEFSARQYRPERSYKAIADELKTLSTKVVKDKVSFNQKETAFGVEVADKEGTYNVYSLLQRLHESSKS